MAIPDPQVLALVQEVLCDASPAWLNQAEQHFLNNLDFLKPIQVISACLTNISTGTFWFQYRDEVKQRLEVLVDNIQVSQ